MLSAVAGALLVWFVLAAVAALALGAFIHTGDKLEDEADGVDYSSSEERAI